MKNKILIFLITILAISCSDPSSDNGVEYISNIGGIFTPADDGVMRNLTSMEIVSDMKSGFNLGNTLDTESTNETAWGNPLTTKEMIDEIAKRGFKTLRIPVTWRFHMGDAPNYEIEKGWLGRVQEIVDWARLNNMYVIINIHHDDEWIIPTYEKEEEVKDRLKKVWTQIANKFIEYGDYVIFETLNEPRHEGTPEEWSGGTVEGRDVLNKYLKASVDAIRATGGNNSNRHLMVPTYAASSIQKAMDDLIIPNNDNKIIVSLHNYFPFDFSLGGTDSTWGTDQDKVDMDNMFDEIYNKFIINGQAVIMGEWSTANQGDNIEDRLRHADYYAKGCAQRSLGTILWDAGGTFDRNALNWPYGNIADIVINATK